MSPLENLSGAPETIADLLAASPDDRAPAERSPKGKGKRPAPADDDPVLLPIADPAGAEPDVDPAAAVTDHADTTDATDLADTTDATEAAGGELPDLRVELHELLLRLAASVPDELIEACRGWLAEDRLDALTASLTAACVTYRVPLDEVERMVLADALAAHDLDPWALDNLPASDEPRPVVFDFAPERPGASADEQDPSANGPDEVDRTFVQAASQSGAVRGLWRSWRSGVGGAAWPPPRRIYVVETALTADPIELTGLLMDVATPDGEPSPMVEAYVSGSQLPDYQRIARDSGALLWAAVSEPTFELIDVFDTVPLDEAPSFDPEHPLIDDAETRDRLVRYLLAGTPLLVADRDAEDVVDTTRGEVVPLHVRTDGRMIWCDATAYYLAEHRLAPMPALVEAVLGSLDDPEPVDDATLHRASVWLQTADEE